ncbi:hypothetical protein AC1031_004725 [Aphanomyces cochlioides]|nr:hypothetical protein AC1031_004725 [Aphanomyces cochlioides]
MLEANNEQLIRQLMPMMKNTTPRAPELDDWIDDDPTPVGILQENPNTIRLMPVETIPVFDGNREDRDAAATWLSRFEETAFSCGWSDVETLRRFKLHTAKPVQDWVSQLDPSFKASWPNLRARFRREYVRSRVSKEAVYYNMRQRPGEHVKDYFVRLNAAAINIRLDYRRSRSILDDHIDHFANSLLDTALGTVIRQQQFVSIDNLESYLERQLANGTTAKFRADTSTPKQTTNTIPISDRVKAKKNNVQFMDEGLGSSRMSPPYASPSYLSPERRFMRWGETTAWRSAFIVANVGESTTQLMDNAGQMSSVRCVTKWAIPRTIASRHVRSAPHPTTSMNDARRAKGNAVAGLFKILSPEVSRYLDCAGLPARPNKQQTPEKEGKHKTRQKEENKKTAQKSARLHSNPQRNTPLEKKVPVIWNISRDSNSVVPSIHFAAKDRTILPWGFELKEGEELGFFTEPKEGEGQHHQALLNAQIMNEDTVILADTGADMSVIHIRAVEWLKLPIDRRKTTRIDGLGSNSVRTIGTAPVKITLGQGIVYCLELDVCDLGDVGFNMVLGMDFLSRACITIDTNRREMSLPDGEWVPLLHRPTRYHRGTIQYIQIPKQT